MIKIFFKVLIVLFVFFALNGATTSTKGKKVQPSGGCATTTGSTSVCILEEDRTQKQKARCKWLAKIGMMCRLDVDCLKVKVETQPEPVECTQLETNHIILSDTSLLREAKDGSKKVADLKKNDKITLISRLDAEGLKGWFVIYTKNCKTGYIREEYVGVPAKFGDDPPIKGNIEITNPKWKQENKLMEIDVEGFVSLIGKINEDKVDQVYVNGEEVFIESNNTFSEMLDVPKRGTEVRVVANKEGQRVEDLNFKIKVK